MASKVVSPPPLRGSGRGAQARTEPAYPPIEFGGKQAFTCVPCTHPARWYNHAGQGSSRGQQAKGILACYARDLALTHSCDQAKSLTQTLGMLSEILS